jgi:hypothetical protein
VRWGGGGIATRQAEPPIATRQAEPPTASGMLTITSWLQHDSRAGWVPLASSRVTKGPTHNVYGIVLEWNCLWVSTPEGAGPCVGCSAWPGQLVPGQPLLGLARPIPVSLTVLSAGSGPSSFVCQTAPARRRSCGHRQRQHLQLSCPSGRPKSSLPPHHQLLRYV